MASKRLLKKRIKNSTFRMLNECDYVMETDSDSADAADKLMDELVDFYDAIMAKYGAAKTTQEIKAVSDEAEKSIQELESKVRGLE